MTPIGNKVIIRPDTAKSVSAGGIHIPESAQDKPVMGTIIFIGPKCEFVAIGDHVLYPKYCGTGVTLDDEDEMCLHVAETELMAIV